MNKDWKVTNVNGVEVIYKEFAGVGTHRYEMTFVINKIWKSHTLVCLPSQLKYKMDEVVKIQKGLEGVN